MAKDRRPGAGSAVVIPLEALPKRGRVRSVGYVESITILPVGLAPSFSAVLTSAGPGVRATDAGVQQRPARIRLIWLGQRRVPGIDAGIRLGFEGTVFEVDGLPTMYNPRYEIQSLLEN